MPGAIVTPASFDWERRRRFQRFHSDVAGTYGQITAGSSRSTDGWNRIILDTGVGANKMAETTEHFHQDWIAYKNVGVDRMWTLPQIMEGYFVPDDLTLPANDSYISVGLGSPNSPPPFSLDENYMALRRNLGRNRWEAVFNNPFGGGEFVQDLGATANNVALIFATAIGFKVRVEYWPKQMVRYYLNDSLVYTYTDAGELLSFFNGAGTASDEFGAYFVSTAANAGSRVRVSFGPMYCETILT